MNVDLCNKCGRPLWNELCAYCRGYMDGVKDTKRRRINEEIVNQKFTNYVESANTTKENE